MTRAGGAARVHAIPAGAPFLATLADALLDGRILPGFPDPADPLSLARATIFLPTRRAARAFAALLAARFAPSPVLLPRLVPLGDVDDAELSLAADGGEIDALAGPALADPALAASFAPALGDTERLLILTRLVLSWARAVDRALLRLDDREPLLVPASPADALALAGDLARLMDALTAEDVPWSALSELVEERHSRYFAITLAFLKIAAEQWPQILAERAASDPVARNHRLILAQADRLRRTPPADPMIVAGSTGSQPATARLIAAIAHLPMGAVVLPGLDDRLDDAAWNLLGGDRRDGAHPQATNPQATHPQAIMHRLLATIGVTRGDVVMIGKPPSGLEARRRFVSEALRPAETTDRWQAGRADLAPDALAGVAVIEAADERVEALAAAVALREALEDEGRTVALITPDRALAERVSAELARWGIAAEDSAGRSLSRSSAGTLARLAAHAAVSNFAPEPLLALLAHPAATFGLARVDVERAAAAIEIGLLRGPAPPAGLAGLRTILPLRRAAARENHAARPLAALTVDDWALAERMLDLLRDAFAGFLPGEGENPADLDLVALAPRHAAALAKIAARDGIDMLPADEGGDELAALFDELAFSESLGVRGRFADYPGLFDGLAQMRVVRRREADVHPRVKIWGLLEARLLHADRVVLGGLDEGVWPPAARTDAFLNRPMRGMLGLSPPERRIGQTAHDFTDALGAPEVVITRALKRGGAPTVASRFLQRMKALAGAPAWRAVTDAGDRYIALAQALDAPLPVKPIRRPAPRPPVALLPRRLSVTAIETLVRDPYAVYARHILGLDPLEGIAVPPGAADRGTLVHAALGDFAMRWPQALPDDPLAEVLAAGRAAFAPLAVYPDIAVLWWPRFERLALAYAGWEQARRAAIRKVHAEIAGRLDLPLPDGGSFALTARADRIEETDAGAVIVDFKTGRVPSSKQIFAGFSPQLTLEAAMLKRGAFQGIAPAETLALLYMHATGGREPLLERAVKQPPGEERTVGAIVEEHFAGLKAMLARYFAGKAGFVSRPFAEYARREGPYDHLARVREWSVMAEGEDA
ncbi:MAG: double-strand break repair protein AddB [Pseudochelatococcus sp.]|jgi:ATP-dependent helicase/nuclease subunit B|uniref:double-strand break repair protein AddB n=1 Tax=Pseudochelatococcus sp. TaxID=2020869 RepID=UPI003D8B0376